MANILDQSFTNVQDIDAFFTEKTGKGFIDYYNAEHAKKDAFGLNHKKVEVPLISSRNSGNWNQVWNSIPSLYGKDSINLAEFLSINIAMAMETGSVYAPLRERVGAAGHPGMTYAFDSVGHKASYNDNSDLGNETAFKLFNDKDYKDAHKHKPWGELSDTTDTKWGGSSFPLPSDKKAWNTYSGFIYEADFMKFRGRGLIQTTGRNNYTDIIKFVMDYNGSNTIMKKYQDKWAKYNRNYSIIATVSSNDDWNELFQETDNIVSAFAVNVHAKKAGKRNAGPKQSQYNYIDVSVGEDKVLRDGGPVWWVGKRINGGDGYASALLGRVRQIVEDLINQDPDAEPLADEEVDTDEEAQAEAAQNDSVVGGDDSGEDNGDNSKIESIDNFFKADETILKLEPIEYEDKSGTEKKKKDKLASGYSPMVSYGGVPIDTTYIKTFKLSSNKILPTLVVSFEDPYGTMQNTSFPLDDTVVKVFLHSRTKSLRHIFMQFKVVSFRKNGKMVYIEGEADVNYFNLRKFEAYQDMTSFKVMQDFSKKAGLGFSSNISDTDDSMTWINPGDKGRVFIEDVIQRSFISDESFLWCYVDFYYNMNVIDIEKQINMDISTQGGIITTGSEGANDVPEEVDEKVTKLYLTTDGSAQTSNIYCEDYKVINQSSQISLNKGYRNKVKYYNQKDFDFNVYVIESLTSDEEGKIIMKGKPQDNEYYDEHSNSDYTGKVDVDNMHKNFNYASIQNKQNIDDLQKIGLVLTLPMPNFNLFKFQKINVIIQENAATPASPVLNSRLSGDWIIVDISFNLTKGGYKQIVNLIKRELDLSQDELKGEEAPTEEQAESKPKEAAQEAEVVEDDPEALPPVEEVEPEPVPEVEPIIFNYDMEFANATEIDDYFKQFNEEYGFFGWFNHNATTDVAGLKSTNIKKKPWDIVWNQIPAIYGKETVNMAEFLSMNTFLFLMGTFNDDRAEIGSYTQNATGGKKDMQILFEVNEDFNNKTVIELSADEDYVKVNKHLPLTELMNTTPTAEEEDDLFFSDREDILERFEETFVLTQDYGGTDRYVFPYGFSVENDIRNPGESPWEDARNDASDSKELAQGLGDNFLSNMDFIKFRMRGMLGNPISNNPEIYTKPETGLDENYPEYSYEQPQFYFNGSRVYYSRLLDYIINLDESKYSTRTKKIVDEWRALVTFDGTNVSDLIDSKTGYQEPILTMSTTRQWNSLAFQEELVVAELGITMKGPMGLHNGKRGENIHIIPDVASKTEDAIKKAMGNITLMISENETFVNKFNGLLTNQIGVLQSAADKSTESSVADTTSNPKQCGDATIEIVKRGKRMRAVATLADGTEVKGATTTSDNETQLLSEMKEKLRDEYGLEC